MCGIAGILQSGGTVDATDLDRFIDALAHRGPDGRGTHIDGGAGLGHRRLAILDLSASGANPMRYSAPDGRVFWITFNGEIYNFLELRKELETLGHRFSTRTDTEVVLASFAQWGEHCLEKFNGMWAFGIWDASARKLLLARDRFGVKPLYYTLNGRLAFASELKAFTELSGFSPQMNEPLVKRILQHSEPWEGATDETMLTGVRSLPAGHSMLVDQRLKPEMARWWETRDHLPKVPARYEDQVEEFRGLFLDAVRLRMRSDVPIATSLSGGVDSSAVASALAWLHSDGSADLERSPGEWQKTFIATFPGSRLDERTYAEAVARRIGADARYETFDPDEATSHLREILWSVEHLHGIIAAPVWYIYRAMRRDGIFVTLDGHGGDEVLGGYAGYLDVPVRQLNEKLYADVHALMLPSILRNYDRCSMAHGVEVRMPLLDWRIVTFAFALPPEAKIGGTFTKRILRDAVNGIVPEAVRTRRSKIGFNAPMIEWFNGPMKKIVEDGMRHPFWNDNPYWDGKKVGEQVNRRLQAGPWKYEDWGSLFQISLFLNLVHWNDLFVERRRAGRA